MSTISEERFIKAEVAEVEPEIKVKILEGMNNGELITLDENAQTLNLEMGEEVVMEYFKEGDYYAFNDIYRLPSLFIIFAAFLGLAFFFAGLRGLGSLLGLGISIAILMKLILPAIIAGYNPLLASVLGAFLIATLTLYLAHGFNKKTTTALLSTILTLCIAGILAVIFVPFTKLSGQTSEEAMFLQFGAFENLDLRGLLLGGIIISVLGILDDITTAQVAAVHEIHKANPQLNFGALYKKGINVGREHIASLVNTLVLAYAGASLPLFLLFYADKTTPVWITLNTEFLVEEIVRTLVGSMTLILAVPISTFFAARAECKPKGRH